MDAENAFVFSIIGLFFLLLGGMAASEFYNTYQISSSKDPVATACALGKKDACVAMANRK